MQEYDFTLKFALQDASADPSDYVDALEANGCDDALIGIGKHGYIALNFIREAESAKNAVFSALADVRSAIFDAVLIEAAPDLVGLTDIAQVIGCSRQNVRKLIYSGDAGSPAPIHDGYSSLWHLADVLEWLQRTKNYPSDERILELALANMSVNAAKSMSRFDQERQEEVRKLVVVASVRSTP